MLDREKSEVEKLARLVRLMLLWAIWLGVIGIGFAFFSAITSDVQPPT